MIAVELEQCASPSLGTLSFCSGPTLQLLAELSPSSYPARYYLISSTREVGGEGGRCCRIRGRRGATSPGLRLALRRVVLWRVTEVDGRAAEVVVGEEVGALGQGEEAAEERMRPR